jgi:hypothetical protein
VETNPVVAVPVPRMREGRRERAILTLVQYAGRLHRLHPGKREVRIFDYVDRNEPILLRMFEKRLREYRAIGYARGEHLSGTRRIRKT